MSSISFNGEFGYEMIGVLPYAYYLHKNGKLISTESSKDTKCFYFFSPNHIEKYEKRQFKDLSGFPIKDLHKPVFNDEWNPPPLKGQFANSDIVFNKPLCIISNKYDKQWNKNPVNYLSLETILSIIDKLKEDYTIVYSRPTNLIVEDGQITADLKEKLKVKDGGALLIEDIYDKKESFNTFQCRLYANCDKFISVQGGGSILCSYFGGVNDIYAVLGGEVEQDSYKWYNKLSGAKINHHTSYDSLLKTV